MKITRPPPSCTQFQTTELPCPTCGRPMKLTLIEPSGPNIELRTYECAACNSGASFLMAIEAASAPPPAVHAPQRRDRASE